MTRANAQPGCRHHVGNLAGFKSERVAGFRLECMAGFVGIRTPAQTGEENDLMIALITFALFAIALALFGLIALVVDIRTIDQSTLLSDLWKR